MHGRSSILRFAAVLLAAVPACSVAAPPKPAEARAVTVRQMRLPLSFEANRGQFDPRVRYMTRTGGVSVFLTDNEAVMVLPGEPVAGRVKPDPMDPMATMREREPEKRRPGAVLRMKVVGARRAPPIAGAQKLPGIVNYFIGNNPRKWHTNIPTYRQVRYAGIYPGTDLVYYGNQQRLEYDFILKPGANPRQIRLALSGATRLHVAANGDLIATTAVGDVALKRPFAYQEIAGRRVQVACDYAIALGTSGVSFRLARYDAKRPLVVDPSLVYATFLHRTRNEVRSAIAVDPSGSVFVAGGILDEFPTTPGSFQPVSHGSYKVFVARLGASGSSLLYATFLGGNYNEWGSALAVDASGNAYVTGRTASRDFPVTPGAFDTAFHGGPADYSGDAFVTKLSPSGSSLEYSTFLGGANGYDEGYAAAVDALGSVYVAGGTSSTDFPLTTGAYDISNGPGPFVAKLNPAGSALEYSTKLKGSVGPDRVYAVAVDATGAAYMTGQASSPDFPVTPGSFSRTFGGGSCDAFVTKLDPSGSSLVYSLFLGGSKNEQGNAISVDATGAAYVAGTTQSADFPSTAGAFQTALRSVSAFVTKITPSGAALVYSTFLGGSGSSSGGGVALESGGLVHVVGTTSATDFPTSPGAYRTNLGGSTDAFLMKLNAAGSGILYSTLLGGSQGDVAYGVAIDPAGASYILGEASGNTMDFPVTPGSYDSSSQSGMFIAKLRTTGTSMSAKDCAGSVGQTVTLSATLSYNGVGVPGRSLVFSAGRSIATAVTDASGRALAQVTIRNGSGTVLGTQPIDVSFAGDAEYGSEHAVAVLDVSEAKTSLVVRPLVGAIGSTVNLSAQLTRVADGLGIGGETVAFAVKSFASGSGVTSAAGESTVPYKIEESLGLGAVPVAASFTTDWFILGSDGVGTLTVVKGASRVGVANPTGAPGQTVVIGATLSRTGDDRPIVGRSVEFALGAESIGAGVADAAGLATVSYRIPPDAAPGFLSIRAAFAGDAMYEGADGVGALSVALPRHPADTNDDWFLTMGEVVAYGSAWKRGAIWPRDPATIPIDFVTNAAMNWRQGESYHYDRAQIAPVCWAPGTGRAGRGPAPGGKGGAAVATISPARYLPGETVRVGLAVTPQRGAAGWAVEERVPTGWAIVSASDFGSVGVKSGVIRWGPFLDARARTLRYVLRAPAAGGDAALNGGLSVDGRSTAVGGARSLQVRNGKRGR